MPLSDGLRPRLHHWLSGLLVALISVLLVISRRPDAVMHAQFWAEDGRYWYQQAHDLPWWQPFLLQENGYLQTVSRLMGALAQALPLAWAPLGFNCGAILFQVLPVLLLCSARGRVLVPSTGLRLLLALLYLGHPYSGEVHANVTNIQWHLVLAATLVLVFAAPYSRWQRCSDALLLGLAGLSGPFALFLTPLALSLAWARRDRRSLGLAALVVACACLQAGLLVLHHGQGDRFSGPLGASPGLLLRLIDAKLILAAIPGPGAAWLSWLPYWPHPWLVCALAMLGCAVLLYGLYRGTPLARAVIALGMMVFAASLILPQISPSRPQWQVYLGPGSGVRYAFLPVLAFYAALVVLAIQPARWLRVSGQAMLLAVVWLGVVPNWRIRPFPDLHFAHYAQTYTQAAAGTEVDIPIYPGPYWTLRLVKPRQ